MKGGFARKMRLPCDASARVLLAGRDGVSSDELQVVCGPGPGGVKHHVRRTELRFAAFAATRALTH